MRLTMTRSWLGALLAALVVVGTLGCGGSENRLLFPPQSEGSPESTEVTLDLDELFEWALPENVTTVAVSGFNLQGGKVFEKDLTRDGDRSFPAPASSKSIEIEYFARGEKVGVVLFDLDLQPGQRFTFQEPPQPPQPFQVLQLDILINADMWESQPRMIAAGLGFVDILGIPDLDLDDLITSEQIVRDNGGTWNLVACLDPVFANFTSARTTSSLASVTGANLVNNGGLPVEFSYPILPSSLDNTDFLVTLNDGSEVVPQAAALTPNYDYNERSCVVLFGLFGNRLGPNEPEARFPVKIEVVDGDRPLHLVGPGGQLFSAVGFSADAPGSPYVDADVPPEERGGPRLVGAKISKMSAVGDRAPLLLGGNVANDGIALYGDQAQYRLRVFTSGGFSPDGVRAVYPDEFQRYYRLQALTDSNETILIEEAGVDYEIDGHRLRVVGLAELGPLQEDYNDCYVEDSDNQMDIILAGDEEAMRRIVAVEVPSVDPYSPFFNPGGPGNQPTPGERYTSPSRPHTQAVLQAIDDPMTVTYIDLRGIAFGNNGL